MMKAWWCVLFPLCACVAPDLVLDATPLADFAEPLELRAEPDDEAARRALPVGCFTGLVAEDARDSLAAKLDNESALRIARIVENSPAAAAGLHVDDVLLEVQLEGAPAQAITRVSEWRDLELRCQPGQQVTLVVDRAGREAKAVLVAVARLRPAARAEAERFREEQRVGAIFRTATEVEARAAGLAPGAGAVIVGLSRSSPWRRIGLCFGDLITHCNGAVVAHPEVLLQALRDAGREQVELQVWRGAAASKVIAPLTVRARHLREVSVPLLFQYKHDRGATEWACLLGLASYRGTAVAWRMNLLWLISFGGGQADRLLEVDG